MVSQQSDCISLMVLMAIYGMFCNVQFFSYKTKTQNEIGIIYSDEIVLFDNGQKDDAQHM